MAGATVIVLEGEGGPAGNEASWALQLGAPALFCAVLTEEPRPWGWKVLWMPGMQLGSNPSSFLPLGPADLPQYLTRGQLQAAGRLNAMACSVSRCGICSWRLPGFLFQAQRGGDAHCAPPQRWHGLSSVRAALALRTKWLQSAACTQSFWKYKDVVCSHQKAPPVQSYVWLKGAR